MPTGDGSCNPGLCPDEESNCNILIHRSTCFYFELPQNYLLRRISNSQAIKYCLYKLINFHKRISASTPVLTALPIVKVRDVKNCEESEILCYLHVEKLARHCFIDAGRKHETLGSETKRYYSWHSKHHELRDYIGSLCPKFHRGS